MRPSPSPAERPAAAPTGRPRKVSAAVVAQLRAEGCGATEIGRRLKVSRWTVYRAIRRLAPPADP